MKNTLFVNTHRMKYAPEYKGLFYLYDKHNDSWLISDHRNMAIASVWYFPADRIRIYQCFEIVNKNIKEHNPVKFN